MADAGRILIIPKGNYNPSVSYEMLDLVFHNDVSWIAKKPVIGVEPSEANADYWFKMVDNSGLQNIINGTTTVGNANKLGGKSASEYFTKEGGTINGSVNIGSANDGTQKRLNLINSKRRILFEVDTDGKAYLSDYTNNKEIISSTADGTNTFNGTASGNLPLSGGTISNGSSNPLHIKGESTNSFIRHTNNSDEVLGFLGFSNANNPVYLQSNGNTMHKLLHTGNVGSYALPLDGSVPMSGTLSLREYVNVYSSTSNAETYSSFIQNVNGTHVRHVTDANNFDQIYIRKGKITYAKMVNGAWSETDIHHDGNSAKVVVSSTPLTAEGSIRVW